jgi:hypothetical protein
MTAQTSRQQADIQDTRRQQQTQEYIGTYKTQEDKTDTRRQHQTQEYIGTTTENLSIESHMTAHTSRHTIQAQAQS